MSSRGAAGLPKGAWPRPPQTPGRRGRKGRGLWAARSPLFREELRGGPDRARGRWSPVACGGLGSGEELPHPFEVRESRKPHPRHLQGAHWQGWWWSLWGGALRRPHGSISTALLRLSVRCNPQGPCSCDGSWLPGCFLPSVPIFCSKHHGRAMHLLHKHTWRKKTLW